MKKLDILAAVLVIVGGLNWGLVALAEFDLVATIFGLDFGETNAASRVVYGLVGLAAVYQVPQQAATRRRWRRAPQAAAASRDAASRPAAAPAGSPLPGDEAEGRSPRRVRAGLLALPSRGVDGRRRRP